MTLLSALRCLEGIVITTDSRQTTGGSGVAEKVTKLWPLRNQFLIAWAGWKNVAQALFLLMKEDDGLAPALSRLEIERRLLTLLKEVKEDGKTDYAEWLIAWWSIPDNAPVALHLMSSGQTQWVEEWQHVGDRAPIAIARPIVGSLPPVPRETMTVEQAKILALKVMRGTIDIGVESIGGDPQVGVVRRTGVEIVKGAELRGLHDALTVWEEQCADLLPGGVKVPAESATPDRGVRPPDAPPRAA